jgi:hypothetical protein
MSQVAHSHLIQSPATLRDQLRAHRRLIVATLVALFAAGAVILVLALDSGSSESTATPVPVSGPSESGVAAAVAGQTAPTPASGPDESSIAASVSGR